MQMVLVSIVYACVVIAGLPAQHAPYVHDMETVKPSEDKMALGDPDFMIRFAQLMERLEGFRHDVYDDYSGKTWTRSAKLGDPTVGIGFNLSRPDAVELLRAAGAPHLEHLLHGRNSVTREQALRLVMLANDPIMAWLKKHFSGIELYDYQWVTLASLAYNSRWNKRGPTLVGPKLTRAIKAANWSAADYEIRENSAGGVPENLKRGIMNRRAIEADIFAGVEDVE